ncbi:transcriptional regulator, TrmB [Acidianus hospitalis W1]|uniref:Transcriptional regulator, TrmB n=1 Tax=Acidianus hospitalis (strain W1) TaxID=933801 RepID=F4B7I6_ACIHW|nr:helix-turn-helix domain-containing protein [Acidianus hospitalis]AEE93591.1 transcriptional regulator, TrmB [Acidianus hospitalis W1]
MDSNPLEDTLARVSRFASILGISRAELRIYSTLLLEGRMTARQLAEQLGISYTKIYSLLTKLEERGWIKRLGKKPAVYEAIPLRDLWASIKKMIEIKVDEFEKEFIEPLSSLLSPSSTYSITMIPSDKIKSTFYEILDEGNKVSIAISYPELLSEDIIQAIKAKSYTSPDLRVIIQSDINIPEISGLQIRKLSNMFGSGLITSTAVLLIIKNADKLSGLFSNHKYIVDIATVYFNHLWIQAK